MTAKQFFKGKAFKCIVVLTCVLLISGILLAIAFSFLEVTDEERFNRKINSVYGGESVTAVEQEIEGGSASVGDATIQRIWLIEEKNDYLVQAYSRGNGGNITCWVSIHLTDDKKGVAGVNKVIIYSVDDPAEYVNLISDENLAKFSSEYSEGKVFSYGDKSSLEYISTGATFSMTAICNAVNGSVEYSKAFASGGKISNPFEGLSHARLINKGKSGDVYNTRWEIADGVISYDIKTTSNNGPDPFTLKIKVELVDGTATVTEYEIVKNGCVAEDDEYDEEYFISHMSPNAKDMTGKTLADVTGYLADETKDGNLVTGATCANELCYEATAFALSNYETLIAREANDE